MDILDYFSQLIPVMEKDKSIYCISAWNDQVTCVGRNMLLLGVQPFEFGGASEVVEPGDGWGGYFL